eukprot:m.19598 g.19598  ORF g.19598 m.19598 type:complete len:414 (-) comp10932_c0_seq3:1080-2321(-)
MHPRHEFYMKIVAKLLKARMISGRQALTLLQTLSTMYRRNITSRVRNSNLFYGKYKVDPTDDNELPWSQDEFRSEFRFSKADIPPLVSALRLPSFIITPERYQMGATEALCVTLRRLSQQDSWQNVKDTFPHRRLTHLKSVFYFVIDHISREFGHLLSLDHPLDHNELHYWSRKILEKGCPYENVCMFVDGKDWAIMNPPKPTGAMKSPFYSGHHHKDELHNLIFASPDGIIRYASPLVQGRLSDASQMLKWRVVDVLEPKLQPTCATEKPYRVYSDSGFGLSKTVMTPLSKPRNGFLGSRDAWLNKVMSSEREEIEHVVGKPGIYFKRVYNLRIFDQAPGFIITAAIILTNCYHCLHRSQTSYYFDCIVPELEDYLNGIALPLRDERVSCDKRVDVSGVGVQWMKTDADDES